MSIHGITTTPQVRQKSGLVRQKLVEQGSGLQALTLDSLNASDGVQQLFSIFEKEMKQTNTCI